MGGITVQNLATLGRTTIKTDGMQVYAESGDLMSCTSYFDVRTVLQGSPFFPSGSLSGAVVVMLGIDGSPNSHEIVVESPPGQDDLETIERTIAQLAWVRGLLSKAAVA